MSIERVIIKNYRALRNTDVKFGRNINIIVGDNETGKSTLLEAINLALRRQINRRPVDYELHPYLINVEATAEFIASHRAGKPVAPPEVLIELYFRNTPAVADLKGSNNSLGIDAHGLSLSIKLDENLKAAYQKYVADPKSFNSVPVEYYEVVWRSFSNAEMKTRAIQIKSTLIDPSSISNSYAANKYVLEAMRDYLTNDQSVELALAYRAMREEFQSDERVIKINSNLAEKKGTVSEKTLSVAMDTTTRASWETGVLPHLNDIPLTLVGKGEQNPLNFGEAKGMTFERTLIFPHERLRKYIETGQLELDGESLTKSYVAVTRARQSVGIVVPDEFNSVLLPNFIFK